MTIVAALAIPSGALLTGGALYVAVVEHPARMRLHTGVAAEQFRSSYRFAAPWQAATALLCALSGVMASIGGWSWVWAAGSLNVGVAVPFTLIGILPTTSRLLAKGGSDVPPCVEVERARRAPGISPSKVVPRGDVAQRQRTVALCADAAAAARAGPPPRRADPRGRVATPHSTCGVQVALAGCPAGIPSAGLRGSCPCFLLVHTVWSVHSDGTRRYVARELRRPDVCMTANPTPSAHALS